MLNSALCIACSHSATFIIWTKGIHYLAIGKWICAYTPSIYFTYSRAVARTARIFIFSRSVCAIWEFNVQSWRPKNFICHRHFSAVCSCSSSGFHVASIPTWRRMKSRVWFFTFCTAITGIKYILNSKCSAVSHWPFRTWIRTVVSQTLTFVYSRKHFRAGVELRS